MRYGLDLLRSLFGSQRAVTPLAKGVATRTLGRAAVAPLGTPAALAPCLLGAPPGAVALASVAATAHRDLGAAARAEVEPDIRIDRRTP